MRITTAAFMLGTISSTTAAVPSAGGLPARAASTPPTCTADLGDKLTKDLTPWLNAQAGFSGVVLVACNGTPVYSATYGKADRATGKAITLETSFNVGSMNKMWTAAAIAQLVQQGKVDLEAPVGRYLPDLTNTQLRDSVRVKHLLSHTSGLGSYFKRGFLRDGIVVSRMTDYLRFFIEDSLAFHPGDRMEYSNAGFVTLGMIIEKVSGMSYYDYMQKNVLACAGMTRASFPETKKLTAEMAIGYASPPGATEATENSGLIEGRAGPAGGAFATAQDVVAFSIAFFGGKLVSPELVKTFTEGRVEMGPQGRYAYGFGTGSLGGSRYIGHNGGGPGIGADFMHLPEIGVDIVVLTNIEMPAASQALMRAAALVTGANPDAFRMATPPRP